MFYLKELKKELLLPPAHFGPQLKETIRRQLIEEVEGTSLGKFGYVVTVYNMPDEDISLGIMEYDTGFVNALVTYKAICFRPFINEVLDATVTNVTELGFVSEVGPLEVFVSRYNLQDDMKDGYDAAADMWASTDRLVEIRVGSGVRLRIIGITIEQDLKAVGSMKDDYMGLVAAPA
ncbi:unnamed protein product [Chrysoparadoxa australica]